MKSSFRFVILLHMKKIIARISVVSVAFLASASAAAYHGYSDVSTLENDPQPVKMTCTILAAWTSSGQSVDVADVRLTTAADREAVTVGVPCNPNGTTCALAIHTITGAPLEAWVSGC